MATWLPELDVDWFWIVGKPASPVRNASTTPPNFLFVESSDAFENIAPKVCAACHYALDKNTDYLCVMDDDTYCRPERLLKSGFNRADYIGYVRTAGLNGVPYIQGSCFWLSARSMEHIILSGEMRNGIIDDGAVGRALVDKVLFSHDYRYEPGPYPNVRPLPGNSIISTHKCTTMQIMQAVHQPFARNTSRT